MSITTNVVTSKPANGQVYSIQHYVTKFVSEVADGRWFSVDTPDSSTDKTDHHDITEILLKVALSVWYILIPKIKVKVNRFVSVIQECTSYGVNGIGEVNVRVLASCAVDRWFELDPDKPKPMNLVCVASQLSTQHEGERAKTGWLRIRIMCPSRAICPSANCCFSDLVP